MTDAYAQDLLKIIEEFPKKVYEAAERYEPYIITRFTVALASSFNKFYHENPILSAEQETLRSARLAMTKMVTTVLKTSLSLIGVQAPEKM